MGMRKFRKQIETATGLMRERAGDVVPRRDFLRMAGAAGTYGIIRASEYAIGEVFTRAVVDPALAERPAGGHFATDTSEAALETMDRYSPVKVAIEAVREKWSVDYIGGALRKAGQDDRFTIADPDSMDRLCIAHQGAGAMRLWDYDLIGRPMGDRPDNPALGAFLHDRYREAREAARNGRFLLQNVVLFPGREDLPHKFRYVGFVAADKSGRVIGVTVPSAAARSPRGGHGPARPEPSSRLGIDPAPSSRPAQIAV